MFTLEKLTAELRSLSACQSYLIAYSGGLDSHVLLYAMVQLKKTHPDIQLQAIHINHNLQAESAAWVQHCQQVCAALQVDFCVQALQLSPAKGESIEAAARTARYGEFKKLLKLNQLLLTAHHADDQAETWLLQGLRGAGIKGLAAMGGIKKLGSSFLARPLLQFTRAQLESYAHQEKLNWIEDSSNSNERFSRNFLRSQIMPLLREKFPSVAFTFSRSAQHCAEANVLLDELAQQDWQSVQGGSENRLSVAALLQLSSVRQRNVLRYWLQQLGFQLPNQKRLLELQKNLLHAAVDALPELNWAAVKIQRYQGELYALSAQSELDVQKRYSWNLNAPLLLPHGQLRAEKSQGVGLSIARCGDDLAVRFRQGGEKIQLSGHAHHQELKKLMQQWQVPPWQRERIPLLYQGDVLISVVGYGSAKAYAAQADEPSWLVKFELDKDTSNGKNN